MSEPLGSLAWELRTCRCGPEALLQLALEYLRCLTAGSLHHKAPPGVPHFSVRPPEDPEA